MKLLFGKVTFALLAAIAPAALHAQQTEAIVYWRATIVLSPAVLQQFATLGVTITDLSQTHWPWRHGSEAPTQNGTNILTALEGAIDLQTSSNEVVYAGGYQIKIGASTIQIRNLTLDLVGPSAIFSGIVIENDTFVGREAIFAISAQGPPSLPIVPQHGTISHNGLSLTFEQPFVNLIGGVAGNSGLNTTAQIGTLDLYSVLAPLTASASSGPDNW